MSKMSQLYMDVEVLIDMDMSDQEIVQELQRIYTKLPVSVIENTAAEIREWLIERDQEDDSYPDADYDDFSLKADQLQW